jgi:hypothetical protein
MNAVKNQSSKIQLQPLPFAVAQKNFNCDESSRPAWFQLLYYSSKALKKLCRVE